MDLKRIKIIATIGIFLMSFISHFVFDLFPNFINSIFFPVNESIMEHMKLITTSTLIYSIIDYYLLKKNNIPLTNFKYNLFLTSTIGIPIYLIIYLPIYHIIGEHLFISITILLITYSLTQLISYYLLKDKPYPKLNSISPYLIIITYIIFTYLTYYPPKNYLFFDTSAQKYSINNYVDNYIKPKKIN